MIIRPMGGPLEKAPDVDGRYYGTYTGYIRDTDDPANKGRLRVFCPEVMGGLDNDSRWLDWAMPSFPWVVNVGAGTGSDNVGAYVPKVDDGWGVWIIFRQGDVRYPIWTGVFPVGEDAELDFNTLQLDANKAQVKLDGNVILTPDTGTNKTVQVGGTQYHLPLWDDFLSKTVVPILPGTPYTSFTAVLAIILTALTTPTVPGSPLILPGTSSLVNFTDFIARLAAGTDYNSKIATNG